jgi:hypothetical protein
LFIINRTKRRNKKGHTTAGKAKAEERKKNGKGHEKINTLP